MGFSSTTFESKTASSKIASCAQKTASREIFSSNRNHVYKIERNPLKTQQGDRSTPTKTASGRPYWPSRDPIEESGGVNLYGFVNNRPTWYWDALGLRWRLVSRNGQTMTQAQCNKYCDKECKAFQSTRNKATITIERFTTYPNSSTMVKHKAYTCECECKKEVPSIGGDGYYISPQGHLTLFATRPDGTKTDWKKITRVDENGKVLDHQFYNNKGTSIFPDFNHGGGVLPHFDITEPDPLYPLKRKKFRLFWKSGKTRKFCK